MRVSKGMEIQAPQDSLTARYQQHHGGGGFINIVADEQWTVGGAFGEFCETQFFPVQVQQLQDALEEQSEDHLTLIMSAADPEQFHVPLNDILSGGAQEFSEDENMPQDPECSPTRRTAFEPWRFPMDGSSPRSQGKYSNKAMFHWLMNHWSNEMKTLPSPSLTQHVVDSQEAQAPAQFYGEQSPQKSPLMNAKEERASYKHMLAERSRRQREKQLKSMLLSLIPHEIVKKKDKNSVLQYAIDYIKLLKSQVQEETSSMTTAKFDEEVSKSSDTTSGNIMVQEDGPFFRLCVDTSNREKKPNMLINMLTCAKSLGFEVESIQWNPETSPCLRLTVHSMNPCVPLSQLAETLEKEMFIFNSEEADEPMTVENKLRAY